MEGGSCGPVVWGTARGGGRAAPSELNRARPKAPPVEALDGDGVCDDLSEKEMGARRALGARRRSPTVGKARLA